MTKRIVPEVYSRIVGYFRPIQNWNAGKKMEFKQRTDDDVKGLNLKRWNIILDEIKQFKETNGNVSYNIKELLYGVHTKLDQINERLNSVDITFASHETWLTAFKCGFGIIFAVLSYLLFV